MFRRQTVDERQDRIADSHLSLMINYALRISICQHYADLFYARTIRYSPGRATRETRQKLLRQPTFRLTNCRCFGQFAIGRVRYSLSSTINYAHVDNVPFVWIFSAILCNREYIRAFKFLSNFKKPKISFQSNFFKFERITGSIILSEIKMYIEKEITFKKLQFYKSVIISITFFIVVVTISIYNSRVNKITCRLSNFSMFILVNLLADNNIYCTQKFPWGACGFTNSM